MKGLFVTLDNKHIMLINEIMPIPGLEDGTIYMDVTLPYLDEGFDPKMVQLTLSLIVQHFAAVYAEIMKHVWGL